MKTQLNRKKRKEIKLLVKQGYKHLEAQEFGIAFYYFNRACTVANHQDGQLFADLGYCSQEMGDHTGAVMYFMSALKLIKNRKKHAHIYFKLGISQYELGETVKAVESFEKGLAIEPHHAPAYISLATFHQVLNNVDEMEQAARRAIEINPSIPAAHNCLGSALMIKERFAEAKTCFETASRLDRDEIISFHYFAMACASLEQWGQALNAVTHVLETYPNFIPAHNLRNRLIPMIAQLS
ncbi:MAG: tetratricopeptide repeat protein [Candidatus Doudnabacteria bacterium]|nr:tetratricopeptide repeat protein [Candidatus Doudnabacteria bacterium]